MQNRLLPKRQIQSTYSGPQLNEVLDDCQRVELSRGCIRNCPFCYEPEKREVFPTPEIVHNYVKIVDMNILMRPDIIDVLKDLGSKLVNGKVIYYEATSGFDYRILTKEIAEHLRKARFIKPKIAWDWEIEKQFEIKDAVDILLNSGYQSKEIGVFMLVNWRIPKVECEMKLDLLKTWGLRVCDCCWDGGYRYAVPEYWTQNEMDEFCARCHIHNQMINFRGIYPDMKRVKRFLKRFGRI
jgi:hypothetical protein